MLAVAVKFCGVCMLAVAVKCYVMCMLAVAVKCCVYVSCYSKVVVLLCVW